MDKQLILAMIEIILIHGPQAAIHLFGTLSTDNPTPEQIRSLKVLPPEDYL